MAPEDEVEEEEEEEDEAATPGFGGEGTTVTPSGPSTASAPGAELAPPLRPRRL